MLAITTAHFAGLLGVLFLWLAPALLVARLAQRKGRPFALYLIVSLVVGWPLTLLAALIVRPRAEP
jgi:small-conductance mechanosensitive channel